MFGGLYLSGNRRSRKRPPQLERLEFVWNSSGIFNRQA
jgi:hypothetical protein